MKFYNSIVSYIIKKRIHQIEFFKQFPQEVQKDVFFDLIYRAKDTQWGKKYHFRDIKSIKDFKKNVKIQTYETLKPQIDKIRKGEQNVLWNTEIKWFAQSSGTTAGKSKFIPISKSSLENCHYKGGKDLMSVYLNHFKKTKVLKGKSLMLGGSSSLRSDSNLYYGDLSAIIIENLPLWFSLAKTPSKQVALHPNWEEKMDKMVDIVTKENVTNISGVPSWNLVLFHKILQHTGKKNILEVWPNLELYIHGGVSFEPFKNQYKELIPSKKMQYFETYNASEGFFGIQDVVGSNEMLLMLDYGIFYEFLPLSEIQATNPKTLQLEEVELNTNYALIISTNAGLWRYLIGDTLEFTSLSPFRFRLTGRTSYFINIFGEELIEDNTNKAVKYASKKTNSSVKEYSVGPIFPGKDGKGGHEWIIEFSKECKDINKFIEYLDLALKNENSDYEAKRQQDLLLQIPKINILKPNTFYQWLKSKNKLGGQHKIPKLSSNRDTLEDILSFKIIG